MISILKMFQNVSLIVSAKLYTRHITIVIFEVKETKPWKITMIAGAALITVALVTASAFAYMGERRGVYTTYGANSETTNSYGGFLGGMMRRGYSYDYGTTAPQTYSGQYGWRGCRVWNNYGNPTGPVQGPTITLDTALSTAKNYLASLNNPDLAIDEVEEYSQNFYVLFYEKSTGIGAFEMIVDKYTGEIYPEMGPNMMWNTKYGMMSGGMMGWTTGAQNGPLTVTVEQAKTYSQQFLDANYPGTTIGSVDKFYGYYHVDVLQAGNTYGMLSVNGYTGQVWYHTWHGTFIQEAEL